MLSCVELHQKRGEVMKYIFLDRDGTLHEDKGLLLSQNDISEFKNTYEALMLMKERGFKLALITNQSLCARGLMKEEQCKDLNWKILNRICNNEAREIFDEVFIAFSHPHAQIERYKIIKDDFRKPGGAAIEEIIKRKGVFREESYMVGDRLTDIAAGNVCHLKSVLINTDQQKESIVYNQVIQSEWLEPNLRFKTLIDFAKSL